MPNSTCPAPGCDKPSENGYRQCQMHYTRFRRHGSYDLPPQPTMDERFWSKVHKTDACWLWTGTADERGYGAVRRDKKLLKAHRVAFELLLGPIPAGAEIDHLCHVPSCVNPEHLRPVTHKQNKENTLLYRNNTSGVQGVFWDKKAAMWRSRVVHNGERFSAGTFAKLEDAAEAVRALRVQLFTHNDRDRS